jgi:hypothetical protein
MEMLSDIVSAIESELAATPLANFYDERKRLKGGHRWNGGFLQVQRHTSEARSGYAFHKGGREELQFNVGFEDEGKYFRYGVAFSLESDRNLPDPVATLAPKIERFNHVLPDFPELFSLGIWSHGSSTLSIHSVGPIPKWMVRKESFIFLGERVKVPTEGITHKVISRAAQVLEMLWPLYHRIEDGSEIPLAASDYRVARLCWNSELWQRPTGRKGKLTDEETFEGEHGFGHEEWLFDLSTLIKGWKYGFIQALNHSQKKYEGKHLSLLLYSIDSKSKRRYWVGSIKDLDVLNKEQARKIGDKFEALGWREAMCQQVENLELEPSTLFDADTLVNVRFRPEALQVFDPPVPFPSDALPSARYGQLQRVPETQSDIVGSEIEAEDLIERNLNATKSTRHMYESTNEVDLMHVQWQKLLRKTLKTDLPEVKPFVETIIDGHRLDAVLDDEKGKRRIFIELKTRGTVRQVIRAALSQLLEYAYWPNKNRCQAMLIVGASRPTISDDAFLQLLRERFNLPVHYLPYQNGHIVGIAEWFRALPTKTA